YPAGCGKGCDRRGTLDDAGFCQKVSDALAEGYVLYGDPVMASCNGKIVCGQAVILPGIIPGVRQDEAHGEDD
ncbi:MAG: DUF1737 domain-containing protein, partial [Alphaproteobacteria bacterium]